MTAVIQSILHDVREGEETALKAYLKLKEIETELSSAIEYVKEDAISEAQQLGTDSGPVEYMGFKLSKVASRASYSYKHIPSWVERNTQLKEVEELAKLGAKNNKEQIDPDTGEIIPPALVTYSKEGLSVKPLK